MNKNLILYNGPTSPFGRKCKITANILKINLKEEKINVYKSEFLDEFNPLRQIPTLIADNVSISDSDNICLYFDEISNQKSLYPKHRYWECMAMINIANGIMENGVNRYIEISSVEKEKQRVKTIERYEKKILRSIQWIEKKIEEFNSKELTMDQIAVACALDYTSFRFSDKWGMNNPKLYKWMKEFSKNQYLQETKPGVSFKYE